MNEFLKRYSERAPTSPETGFRSYSAGQFGATIRLRCEAWGSEPIAPSAHLNSDKHMIGLGFGENSQIRMVSPSLTNTQVEVMKGEAMVEVADLLKDNNIEILDRGGSMRIEKTGLYRVTADDPPTASVIEGKAELSFGDRKID